MVASAEKPLKLDQQLTAILAQPAATLPLAPGRPAVLKQLFLLLWQQSSVYVGAEVALVVMLVVALSPAPSPRQWMPAPPAEAAMVLTQAGQVWELPLGRGGRLRRLSDPHPTALVPRFLGQDPVDQSIEAVDARSGSVVGHVPSPQVAHLLARQGRYFGLSSDSTSLFELTTDTLRTQPIFQSTRPISDVALTQDGGFTFVACPQQDDVLLLDRNHQLIDTLHLPGTPSLLSLERGGSELWAAGPGSLHVVNLATRNITSVLLPWAPLGLVSGADRVYVIGPHAVTVMQAWSAQESVEVQCPTEDPVAWAVSPVSGTLVVATRNPPSLDILDAANHWQSVALQDTPALLWWKQ